ncbi:MAG: S8 family serine peptidase [Acidobacteria bacterium]|nr:S8 family serine peptidase [Acidobacteriota bacterium]
MVRLATNDQYFSQQWGLLNTVYSGRDIHAEQAWAITTGNSEVIVAVIDSGLDYGHDDILNNLWQNPNEIPDDNQDNDKNGFIDDMKGWNFVAASPGNSDPMDDHTHQEDQYGECIPSGITYHGTHTSGIIGAVGNNEIGISGVCWNVKIMPIKAFNYCGQSSNSILINAIDYATNNGAFLTSNSYGNFSYSLFVKSAITRAQNKNRLYVVSAGNENVNIDSNTRYPVCYPNGNIIGVMATNQDDTKSDFSNYGQNSVDIAAPGYEIMSLKLGDTVQNMSGTSQAAPFVAGVAALALGVCPGLTYGRIKDLIIDGADYVANLNNKCVADGRLNAYNVLNTLGGDTPPSAPSNLIVYPINWYTIGITWNDNSNNELGFEIQRKDTYRPVYIHDNCADMNSTSTVSYQDTIDTSLLRTYTYRIRAVNRAGVSSFSNAYEYLIPQTAPDAPTDLHGQSPVLEQAVNFYWTNHANNAIYNYLERRIPGETDWEVIATLGYNTDFYMDNYAQAGRTYEYRVRAGNPIGYSSYSNILSVEVIQW